MTVDDILPLIFGAGGVAFLGACVQAWRSWHESAEAKESKALRNIERWNDECWQSLSYERQMGAHWYRVVGILQYHIAANGLEQPVIPEPPALPMPINTNRRNLRRPDKEPNS
jgi:hypothetical protein